MKKIPILLLFFIQYNHLVAQPADGYWDNVRITSETFSLSPRQRIYIKTENFPAGTTEVVYRITVLDDNQKISNSLFSVLKSIPDPTGISQGSAGAVLLLSTISGDDKCKYGIYSSESAAKKYIEDSKTDSACFFQNNAINKEAKLLTTTSKCGIEKNNQLYFVFTSDNWIMKQKIILEVVPWINTKASRGWTAKTKQEILNLLKTSFEYKNSVKKNSLSAQFLDEVTQKQSYSDFKALLEIEKASLIEKTIQAVLIKTGEIKAVQNQFRKQAENYFDTKQIALAINLLQDEIIDKNYATAADYCALGRYYLYTKQFDKALQALQQSQQLDSAFLKTHLNIAHVYMYTNKLSEAKAIHKKYKHQNTSATTSWIDQTDSDFKLFEAFGFSTENFEKIKSIQKK